MNTLTSSGNQIQIAQATNYTLLDNEVAVNNIIYKKDDIKIAISGNDPNADQLNVKVGIYEKYENKGTPANLANYLNWLIDGVAPTSLSNLVEQINTLIQ